LKEVFFWRGGRDRQERNREKTLLLRGSSILGTGFELVSEQVEAVVRRLTGRTNRENDLRILPRGNRLPAAFRWRVALPRTA